MFLLFVRENSIKIRTPLLWNTGYTKAFFKQALRFVVSDIVKKGVLLIYTGNGPKFALTYMRVRNFGDCCEYFKDCCLGLKSQMMGLVLFSINTNRKAVLVYRQFYLSLNQRVGVADEVFGHNHPGRSRRGERFSPRYRSR